MMAADSLSRVRGMLAHLARPYWMLSPPAWWWEAPNGGRQTIYSDTEPGLSNLLWLAMDMDTPPAHYSAAKNGLMTLIFAWAPATTLGGVSILDAAAVLPLKDFYALLAKEPAGPNPLQTAYPLLLHLAKGRLNHA